MNNKYHIFDWMGEQDISDLTKPNAKKIFNAFMEGKDSRVTELKKLVEPNLILHHDVTLRIDKGMAPLVEERKIPKTTTLDHSVESLQALNEWVIREGKKYGESLDPSKRTELFTTQQPFYRCNTYWKSIATDCAIYMGEMFQKDCSTLYWDLGPSKKRMEGRWYPDMKGWPNTGKEYGYTIPFYIYLGICGSIFYKLENDMFVKSYSGHKRHI